jgi:hypothetical protein
MEADCIHTGFNNTGYLYCSKDQTVLVFSSYDKVYSKLVGGPIPPWGLAWKKKAEELKRVEDNLISCPCGGHFSFENPLICPVCKGVFSEPIAKNIRFFVLDRVIDGQKTNVWKCSGP